MSEYYQKLRESGEDLCFAVTYQLTENFAKYSRQYRSEYVKAKTESEVREISLTGTWSGFLRDFDRTYQGD